MVKRRLFYDGSAAGCIVRVGFPAKPRALVEKAEDEHGLGQRQPERAPRVEPEGHDFQVSADLGAWSAEFEDLEVPDDPDADENALVDWHRVREYPEYRP